VKAAGTAGITVPASTPAAAAPTARSISPAPLQLRLAIRCAGVFANAPGAACLAGEETPETGCAARRLARCAVLGMDSVSVYCAARGIGAAVHLAVS
jgi:hypothetical protein